VAVAVVGFAAGGVALTMPSATAAAATHSLWADSDAPAVADSGDAQAVELGTRFRADRAGTVDGVRFYKAAANTGTHTGSLWTAGGTLLATVTFGAETASGWQSAQFPQPVAIAANTSYVVSYHTAVGHYSGDNGGFDQPRVSGPLQAPASTGAEPNGLYRYGASGFPTSSFRATNYWVDVVFSPTVVATPSPSTSTSTPPTGTSCDLPGYPTAACTGVPAGWTPTTTINGDLVVTTPGTVIQDYLVTGTIDVRAADVTIRRTRVYGRIDNFLTNTVYGHLLIEDSEVVNPPGQTYATTTEYSIGVANYTCRRCKIVGKVEGWRMGAASFAGAGPIVIEHSYALLLVSQEMCDTIDPHGDGIQAYGSPFATIHHNTIDQRSDPCPTGPIFIPDDGNAGATVTDNVVAGGGWSVRLAADSFPAVTGNKVVDRTWGYGPLDVDCSKIGTWSGNATVTFDWTTGRILSEVRALGDCD
jgi:hypothetical protein